MVDVADEQLPVGEPRNSRGVGEVRVDGGWGREIKSRSPTAHAEIGGTVTRHGCKRTMRGHGLSALDGLDSEKRSQSITSIVRIWWPGVYGPVTPLALKIFR